MFNALTGKSVVLTKKSKTERYRNIPFFHIINGWYYVKK